jgi:hypothetical protein
MATRLTESDAMYNRKKGFPYEYRKKIFKELPTNEDCEFLGKESHITSHGGVFICNHCHKLVFVDNIAENVGNTVKCECGHMYVIESEVYYEQVESATYCFGDPRDWDYIVGFWEVTKPIIYETAEPYRRVISANCVPIVLKSGKHYCGQDFNKECDNHFCGNSESDPMDIAFTLSLMTEEQKNIVFLNPYPCELNSCHVVCEMQNYRKEEIRQEKERIAIENARKEAELAAYKAEKVRRILKPWNKFWGTMANICTKVSNWGQPE